MINHSLRRPWLVIILILLAAAGMYTFCFSSTFVGLLDALGAILEPDDRPGYVFPTSIAQRDFFGRVYKRTRINQYQPASASNPAEASARIGFPVVVPTVSGMEAPLDFYNISLEHAYDVHIDLDEARRILSASPSLAAELPAAAQDFQVKVEIPPGVVIHQHQSPDHEHYYHLIQNLPGEVQVDDSNAALLDSLQDLGLRSLGLSSEEAQQVNRELGRSVFYALPPDRFLHAEAIKINGSPALLFSQSAIDPALYAVVWKADGVLYELLGILPTDELLQAAESLNNK